MVSFTRGGATMLCLLLLLVAHAIVFLAWWLLYKFSPALCGVVVVFLGFNLLVLPFLLALLEARLSASNWRDRTGLHKGLASGGWFVCSVVLCVCGRSLLNMV